MRASEKFTGTFFEVKRKLDEWNRAHPERRIIHEGAPVAAGEKALLLDEPVWALKIEFEEPNSN